MKGFMPFQPVPPATLIDALRVLNDYSHVIVVSFIVAVFSAPLLRRVAFRYGIVDRPDSGRKLHDTVVPYLGGVAVFAAVLAGIGVSYWHSSRVPDHYASVPIAIIVGMVAIMITGLADDIWHWDPRLKIAGQLVAAAALTMSDVGTDAIEGALRAFTAEGLPPWMGFGILGMQVKQWIGTAVVAIFVLGGCNSANLIDGLDGLLSGVIAIAAVGLLIIALLLVPFEDKAIHEAARYQSAARQVSAAFEASEREPLTAEVMSERLGRLGLGLPKGWDYDMATGDLGATIPRDALQSATSLDEARRVLRDATPPSGYEFTLVGSDTRADVGLTRPRSSAAVRIVLALALLGAVVGFLPHNLKPASIFLGDCGSLMLGYLCAVIMLLFGDYGHTHFVLAGLIIYAVPVMDTILAIVRRRLAGVPMSAADDQHLHHQLRRALGGVARAVFAMYGIAIAFAVLGVSLAAGVIIADSVGVRVLYAITFVFFAFVSVIAVKAARREQWRRKFAAASESGPIDTDDDA